MAEMGGASRLIAKELEKVEKHSPSRKPRGKPPVGKGVRREKGLIGRKRKKKPFKPVEEKEEKLKPIGGIGLDTDEPERKPLGPGAEKPEEIEEELPATGWIPPEPRETVSLVIPKGQMVPGTSWATQSIPPSTGNVIQADDGQFYQISSVAGKLATSTLITDTSIISYYTSIMPEQHEPWKYSPVEEYSPPPVEPKVTPQMPIMIEGPEDLPEQIALGPGTEKPELPVITPSPPIPIPPPPPNPANWNEGTRYRIAGTRFTFDPEYGYAPVEWLAEKRSYEEWFAKYG